MEAVVAWVNSTAFHDFMINNAWPFPLAETLHFMGLTMLFGAILTFDLRGLGLIKGVSLIAVHKLVPLAVGAFLLNLVTGISFMFVDPTMYLTNPGFQVKMALIVVAGINALAFEFLVFRKLLAGVDEASISTRTKVMSGLSILVWTLVIVFGRALPYTGSGGG